MAISVHEAYGSDVNDHEQGSNSELYKRPDLRVVGGTAYAGTRVHEMIESSQADRPRRWDQQYGQAEAEMRRQMQMGLI